MYAEYQATEHENGYGKKIHPFPHHIKLLNSRTQDVRPLQERWTSCLTAPVFELFQKEIAKSILEYTV